MCHSHLSFTEITKHFEIRQSSPVSSSMTSSTSFLMFGTLTYGTLSCIHRPSNQSTLQSPEPVVDASSGAPPRPLPVFQVTRWMPTSGGHTPVLLASNSSFLARFAFRFADPSPVSCQKFQYQGVCFWNIAHLWKEMIQHTKLSRVSAVVELKDFVDKKRLQVCFEHGVLLIFTRDAILTTNPLRVDFRVLVVRHEPSADPTAS